MGVWMAGEHRIMEVLHRGKEDLPRIVIDELTRELDLSQAQKARVTEIVCRAHGELMDLRRRTQPDKKQIIERSILEMKAELSPEQQKKLDALHREREERRAGWERVPGSTEDPGNPCQSLPQKQESENSK
jgi:CO dehydrogenase/acetyl-CoA synthase alpha subunit